MFDLFRRIRSTPCNRRAAYLASFAARLREHGISDKGNEPFADADVCGRTAGLFAVLVNGTARVSPARRLTDQEFAILWIGFIGADGATQMIGEDLEFAALSAFAMMIDQAALPRLPDLIDEVNAAQHRLIAEVPNEFGEHRGHVSRMGAQTPGEGRAGARPQPSGSCRHSCALSEMSGTGRAPGGGKSTRRAGRGALSKICSNDPQFPRGLQQTNEMVLWKCATFPKGTPNLLVENRDRMPPSGPWTAAGALPVPGDAGLWPSERTPLHFLHQRQSALPVLDG